MLQNCLTHIERMLHLYRNQVNKICFVKCMKNSCELSSQKLEYLTNLVNGKQVNGSYQKNRQKLLRRSSILFSVGHCPLT